MRLSCERGDRIVISVRPGCAVRVQIFELGALCRKYVDRVVRCLWEWTPPSGGVWYVLIDDDEVAQVWAC